MKTPSPYHDEFALMRSFATGEKNAFDHIYKQLHLPIFKFAERFLPSADDAKDITADTFVKLWNNRDQFRSLDHVRAFLHSTAKNSCIDFLRHEKIKDEKHAQLIRQVQENSERQFQLEELRTELMQLVYAEVEKMPAKMKEIFLLSYKQGLKPAEIAERLHISVQTVSNQKLNAIKLLKIALGNNPLLSLVLALLLSLEFPQSSLA